MSEQAKKSKVKAWKPPAATYPINWSAILNIPIAEYEGGKKVVDNDLEQWIDVATKFNIDDKDAQWQAPESARYLCRVLRILLAKCDDDANRTYTEKEQLNEKLAALKEQVALKDRETKIAREEREEALRNLSAAQKQNDKAKEDTHKAKDEAKKRDSELGRLRKDIEDLNATISRLNRDASRQKVEIEGMRRDAESKEFTVGRTEQSNSQLLVEHNHLIKKYRSAADENVKLKDELEIALRSLATSKTSWKAAEDQLRQHINSLQQETSELTLSRDRAETLLERREREALEDLQEMQQLHQQELEDRESHNSALRDQYVAMKAELDNLQRSEAHVPEHELRAKDIIIDRLRRENDELRTGSGGNDLDNSTSIVASTYRPSSYESNIMNKFINDKTRLEQENDNLQSEVRSLEIRMESQDSENLKLAKALKEYESGDEGLRSIRSELADANRTLGTLADENQQLRERLGNVEDTVTLCEALKELCLKVGVTQDEIESLYNKGHTRYNEMETLRQEVKSLKEEVDWVEKERKHWMRKVRLQPLLDTKLRFELGLSQDQLTQLDYIVDQMKSGGVVIDDGDYRERYYEEVKSHQRQVQVFNEQMRQRIEAVLASFIVGGGAAPEELEDLKRRMANAAANAGLQIDATTAAKDAESHAGALQRRVHQQELSHQEALQETQELRVQVIRLETERDLLRSDLELYRGFVLEGAVGVESPESPLSESRSAEPTTPLMVAIPAPPNATDTSLGNVSAVTTVNERSEANIKIREALIALRRRNQQPTTVEEKRLANVLQQQVKAKEQLLVEKEREMLMERQAANKAREEVEAATKTTDELTLRLKLKCEEVEAANAVADSTEAKVQELERIKADLQTACSRTLPSAHNELLQKIVLLRQREGRLTQRLREVMQDRDRLSNREREQELYITEHLEVIKGYLTAAASGNPNMQSRGSLLATVMPNRIGQVQLEDDVLSELQRQMATLARGSMFQEDRAFIFETRRLYVDLQQQANVMELVADVSRLRRELDNATSELEQAKHQHGSGSGSQPQPTSASTDLYTKRLEAKAQEVQHLEAALREAQAQVEVLRHVQAETIQEDGVNAGAQASPSNGRMAEAVSRLEKELARYKSMNLGLVQSAIDEQASRKGMQIQLQTKDREILLLKESGHTQTVTDFIAAALKDSVVLMQQNEMAQHMTKKMKLQLVVAEANFRVTANEAAGYKLSAYRLYKNYVDHVTKIIEVVRRLQRTCEGTMTAHEVSLQQKRMSDVFHRSQQVEEELIKAKANAALTNETVTLLEDQLSLLRAKGPAEAAQLLSKFSMDTRAMLKGSERANITLKEDIEHLKRKLDRTEDYTKSLEKEVGRLEVQATGFDMGDGFTAKLQMLHDTVFAKSEAPPVALTVVPDASAQYLNGNSADDQMIRSYRDALDKQASLSKQCSTLTEDLKSLQKQALVAEGKINALREELVHAESRASAANANIEGERTKARQREERMALAHKAQSDVMQRAVDHNTSCLKEIIKGKERSIAKLQEQLAAEREKFLEHQLLDTTRMERLHDQMFKENNAMVERFKASLSGNGGRLPPASHPEAPMAAAHLAQSPLEASLKNQVSALTAEVADLRRTTQDLRAQNVTLESSLSEQMLHHQRNLREALLQRQKEQQDHMLAADVGAASAVAAYSPQIPMPALLPVESSLYALTHDQSIALDALRRREADLQEASHRQATEIVRLQALVREAPVQAAMLEPSLSAAGIKALSAIPAQESLAELHLYITTLESQLRNSQKETLDSQLTAQKSSIQWREQLENLKAEVAAQTASLEQTKGLVTNNESLRAEMAQVQSQHDKMVAATAMLMQRLQQKDIAHEGREKQLQGDIALAQNMGTLQQEASEKISHLQLRMASVQQELQSRMNREETLLVKAKEAQKTSLEQHEQLLAKDITIRQLTLQISRLKECIERKRQPSLRCAEAATQTTEPLRFSHTSNPVGITTVDSVLHLPPGFEVPQRPIVPVTTEVAKEPKALTENKFSQTDLPPPSRSVSPKSRAVSPRTSPQALVGTRRQTGPSPPAPTQQPQLASPEVTQAVASLPNHGVTSTKQSQTSRRTGSAVATLRRSAAASTPRPEPKEPTIPIDPSEINRIVAKLQKEHGNELLKYRDMSKRLERDLEDCEGAHRRDMAASEAANKLLSSQVNDLRAKLVTTETAHREEMLRFLQERNRQQITDRPSRPSRAVIPLAAAGHTDPTGGQPPTLDVATSTVDITKVRQSDTQPPAVTLPKQHTLPSQQAQITLATEELRLHQSVRKLKEELDERSRQLMHAEKGKEKVMGELNDAKRYITHLTHQLQTLQSAFTSLEASKAKGQTAFLPTVQTLPIDHQQADYSVSPADIRSHKKEVLRLEGVNDQLRRELSVTKELEIRGHVTEKEKLILRVRELETQGLPTTGMGEGPHEHRDILKDKLNVITALENKTLQLEGQLLDLRFEREMLSMRCQRLDKHLTDVLLVDSAKENKAPNAKGRYSQSKDVAALETVIEHLRAVVEQTQRENVALKGGSVSNSKYVDAVREVKALKLRERELADHLQVLNAKIQEHQSALSPGGRVSDHHASLQRKLRLAQTTADQYQSELQELRSRMGMPPSPSPAPRPETATAPSMARVSTWEAQQMDFISQQQRHLEQGQPVQVSQVARALSLSPFAAELHHLDRHHQM